MYLSTFFNVNIFIVDFGQVKEGVTQLFSYRICDIRYMSTDLLVLSSANF